MDRVYNKDNIGIYVYDFDKTIYDGDSTIDFFLYCLKRNRKLLRYIPTIAYGFIKYYLNKCNKTELKSIFFSFLNELEDVDKEVQGFWKLNHKKIKEFYLEKIHRDDIIISASPEFLLSPLCMQLKIKDIIASKVDKNTGQFLLPNCYGEEKVRRLNEKYKNSEIIEFYSDSKSDLPLARLARKAFLVDKENIQIWEVERDK